jgi:phosphatidylglycerophosphate synthase
MRQGTWTVANLVTLVRLSFLPLLWWSALRGHATWVGIGVVASLLADILDGQLARRLKQVTTLGSRLDSVADASLVASAVVWLTWFRPELLRQPYLAVAALATTSWLLAIGIGLARLRHFPHLHLYSAKASGVAGALFVGDALLFGFHPQLFCLACGLFTLSNIEELAVLLTRAHVDENVGSILRRPRAGAAGAAR